MFYHTWTTEGTSDEEPKVNVKKRKLEEEDAWTTYNQASTYVFHRSVCCPKASEYTILASHPVLAADAAHLRGPVQGFLMTFSILTV